jgi:phage-related holin
MTSLENVEFSFKSILFILVSWISVQLAYVGLNQSILIFLASAFTLDLISGMIKAIVIKKFSSDINFTRIVAKGLAFLSFVTLAIGIKSLTGKNPEILLYALMGALGLNDLLSSLSNIYVIYTKKDLPERDFFPLIMSLVLDYTTKKIESILKKLKK